MILKDYYNAETIKRSCDTSERASGSQDHLRGQRRPDQDPEGKLAGTSLVCIRDIKELKGIIKMDSGDIYIGAGTTFSHITSDPVIQENIPVLGEAVDQVGGPQIRNIGTIGGNICNGAVSADSAPALFSLNAMVRTRTVPAEELFPYMIFIWAPAKLTLSRGTGDTYPDPGERIYRLSRHYIKYSMRRAMDIATLGCCVVSRINPSTNILEDIRITFGVAAPVPLRCVNTEEALKGSPVNEKLYQAIEDKVREEIHPRDSWRASREFRLQIGGEIAGRALKRTVELAAGGERK